MKSSIKKVESLKDFMGVYQVFSGPPYYEKYTEEELEEIFKEYQEKGYLYGAYRDEKCIGIVALEKGAKKEQPVNFEEERIMYLADIAVLENYRKTGLGTQLMLFSVMQAKQLEYQKIYMRTLEKGKSMSYCIAEKIGFVQIPDLYQMVERQRVDGEVTPVQNIFLELDLMCLNRDLMKQNIQTCLETNQIEKSKGGGRC